MSFRMGMPWGRMSGRMASRPWDWNLLTEAPVFVPSMYVTQQEKSLLLHSVAG